MPRVWGLILVTILMAGCEVGEFVSTDSMPSPNESRTTSSGIPRRSNSPAITAAEKTRAHGPEYFVMAPLEVHQMLESGEFPDGPVQMTARVPGITPAKFQEIAADAKANCPVSRVLNAKISLDAKLDA